MKVALAFMDFYIYGHSRRVIEESLRVFNGRKFCFYLDFRVLPFISKDLLVGKEINLFSSVRECFDELARRRDIDVIVFFDLYRHNMEGIREADLSHRRLIIYNASVNLLFFDEEMELVLSKGFVFLLENEVACHIAKKYASNFNRFGFLPFPISVSEDFRKPSFDLVFPGSFEERKGASVFLSVLPMLLKRGFRLRATLFGNERFLGELARYRDSISLREEPDRSQEDFVKELTSAKVCPLFYDPYEHSLAGSGILRECMFYGIPVVATEGSWLSYYLERNGGAWVPLDNRIDSHRVFEVIVEALSRYNELKDRALRARERVQAECSSRVFRDKLLKLIEGDNFTSEKLDLPERVVKRAESYLWFMKANIAYRRGKKSEAQEHIDKALSIDPNYWRTLFLKSELLLEQGDYRGALELIEVAETNPLISPTNKAFALVEKAKIFERMGRYSLCIDSLEELRRWRAYLSSRNVEELIKLSSLRETKLLDDILRDSLNYVALLSRKAHKIRFMLEALYVRILKGEPLEDYLDVLLEEIETVSREDPSSAEFESLRVRETFYELCCSFLSMDRQISAKRLLSIFELLCQRLGETNSLYVYSLASLYERLGELDKAYELFKSLLDRGFHVRSGVYFHLGEIAFKKGNKDEAIKFYHLCLKCEPNHSLAKERLYLLGGA